MTIRAERALGITLDRFAFVVCTEKGPVGAVTDADGRAVVSVSAPEGPSRVYVAPSEYNRPEGMSQEEFRECKRRTISLVNSVAMPKEMSQVVAAEVSAVEFVWKAERAARSLKMDVGLNEDNEVGLVMFYWLRHGQWVLAGKDPREASINCLRPGHADELFVKTLGPLVVPVPIPAVLAVAQGTSEPDPPKLIINLPTYPRESVLQMKVQNFANVYGYDYVYCRGGVTLVRDDGVFVFYFNANAAGDLFAVPESPTRMTLTTNVVFLRARTTCRWAAFLSGSASQSTTL